MKRLLVPYFSVSAIIITIKLITEGNAYVENPVIVMSYVKMFYFPEAGYFLWFIWALWWMFVLVPLFETKQARLGVFTVAFLAHYIPSYLPELFCFRQFQNMLIYFMLGVVCCDWKAQLVCLCKVPSAIVYILFIGGEAAMLLEILGGKFQYSCRM